jgi:hypothetical protein
MDMDWWLCDCSDVSQLRVRTRGVMMGTKGLVGLEDCEIGANPYMLEDVRV